MKKFKVAKKAYSIEEKCPNCEGKGYIEVEVFDKFVDGNKKLAYICPQCNNQKNIIVESGERFEIVEVEVVGTCNFEDGRNFVIEEMPDGSSKNSIFLEDGLIFSLEKFPENVYFDSAEEAENHINNLEHKDEEIETDK